jgi:hypothetical protein
MVELDADLEQIKNRLRARDDNNFRETSDARLEDLEKLNAAYESPSRLSSDLIRISATGRVSDTVKAVLVRLAENAARRTNSFLGDK